MRLTQVCRVNEITSAAKNISNKSYSQIKCQLVEDKGAHENIAIMVFQWLSNQYSIKGTAKTILFTITDITMIFYNYFIQHHPFETLLGFHLQAKMNSYIGYTLILTYISETTKCAKLPYLHGIKYT